MLSKVKDHTRHTFCVHESQLALNLLLNFEVPFRLILRAKVFVSKLALAAGQEHVDGITAL